MADKKEISHSEWILLVLGAAFLFGSIIRFFPGLMAGFPLNDGGMFLSMTQDLKESHYILPVFTSYNHLEIPYAYPPFGFYLTRFVSDVFRIPELELLRWIPPLVNTLSIAAFFLLSSELLRSKILGALASAFYSLTPGAFGWFVMGGGLTRSFGSLFLLLTVLSVTHLFQKGERKFIGLSILSGGLTVLSHPEAGIHAMATCILVWIFFGQTVASFRHAVIVGFGVLLVTAPWWGSVIFHHNLTPFLSAIHTGSYKTPLWEALYGLVTMGEGVIPILVILRLIGLGWAVWKRHYFLLAWTLLPFLTEPRSAQSVAYYPISILIALAFAEAIPFLLSRVRKKEPSLADLHKNVLYNSALFLVLIVLFVDSGLYGFRLVGNSLKPADLEAMAWISENTSPDASFLPLTGIPSPEIDPFVEWFPALTGRRSQTTIQGLEWTLGEKFYERYADLMAVQTCETVACVADWSDRTGLEYQHLVVREAGVHENILRSLQDSQVYQKIFSNEEIQVFKLIVK